jgi:uncharacterized protein (DUF433 family)
MTKQNDRIVNNPEILVGKPIIKATRISVELMMGCLADGWRVEDTTTAYPGVSRDDVLAAIAFATAVYNDAQESEYTGCSR